MCTARRVSVGVSKAPMATAIQSRDSGSKNSDEPQTAQKPRRAVSDERYQVRFCSPWIVSADLATSVEAKTCPECLRHMRQ